MLKIGDFSNLTRVTIKALRYYDELGLLKPVKVDEFTCYRYYCQPVTPIAPHCRVKRNGTIS